MQAMFLLPVDSGGPASQTRPLLHIQGRFLVLISSMGRGKKREESDPHVILQIIRFKTFFIKYRHHNEMLSSEMQKNSLEEIHKPKTLDTDIISSSNCNFA